MKADAPTENTIRFGTRDIPYQLIREQRKRVRILITPDLTVSVSAPKRAADNVIAGILHKKARWIAKKLDEMKAFHPIPGPKQYLSGETFRYLGRQYRLKVEQGPHTPAKLKGKFLHVTVPDKTDRTAVKNAVEIWYRMQAERTFHRYAKKCTEVTTRHGVPEASISLRKMRTRWGSCSNKGRITINTNLIQAPVHCIEYVIMHELCHLKHHNHSKTFYKLLTLCMPDWQRRKEALHNVIIHADE